VEIFQGTWKITKQKNKVRKSILLLLLLLLLLLFRYKTCGDFPRDLENYKTKE